MSARLLFVVVLLPATLAAGGTWLMSRSSAPGGVEAGASPSERDTVTTRSFGPGSCVFGEAWLGENQPMVAVAGDIAVGSALRARISGSIRWSPSDLPEGSKASVGDLELLANGTSRVIYHWDAPTDSVSINVPIGAYLRDSDGSYRLTWRLQNGHGLCVKARVVTNPGESGELQFQRRMHL